jgi:ribose transport system permease protein
MNQTSTNIPPKSSAQTQGRVAIFLSNRRRSRLTFSQEQVVLGLSILIFTIFACTLRGFLTAENVLSMLQSVSILGILGIGMAIAVIGRGIDLSIVSTMVMSVAWMLALGNLGVPLALSLSCGLGIAVLIGLIEGTLIAYVEIPAIFATLAMSSVIYGFGRLALVSGDIIHVSKATSAIQFLGNGFLLGIPMPVVIFGTVAIVGYLLLQHTVLGRFIRGIGDNPSRARIVGIPTRPIMIVQYVISSIVGFVAGLVMSMLVGSMNTRLVNSTMVYDVILVVVLGGIGLSGGRGGVRNVLVGTLLIGILFNGMTILNVPYILQNLIKGVILLVSVTVDTLLNPRDEQTSQQGDI